MWRELHKVIMEPLDLIVFTQRHSLLNLENLVAKVSFASSRCRILKYQVHEKKKTWIYTGLLSLGAL